MARILGSKLCDVMGPLRVLLLSATVDAVATMMLPLATNWMWLICYCIVYGLTDGLMAIASILSILQILTQKQKAQGFGFQQLFICTAFLCGPPVGGKPQGWNTLVPRCNKVRFGQTSIKSIIQTSDLARLSSFVMDILSPASFSPMFSLVLSL